MTTTEFPEYTQTKNSKSSDVTTSGTVDASGAVQMTISAEGTAHIMSLLTDLYSDPNLAVLREYASNGKDSHDQAGNTSPILVSLPSRMSSTYVVQDFGVGMSSEEIKTIYSAYGASTKRNDFTQMGAFGLGCKAALTITQQFTLVSVKNGRKATVIISRGDDGVGSVNVISDSPTTDANGVTVSIPISDVSAFNANTEKFFYTWKPGTVLVNGVAPTSLYDDGYLSSDDGIIHVRPARSYNSNGLRVVMGSVAYSVDIHKAGFNSMYAYRSLESTLMGNTSAVVDIPIGTIDLTPSREDIRYSDRTKKFLGETLAYAYANIAPLLTKYVEKAETRFEVLSLISNWSFLSQSVTNPLTGVMWHGEEVPMTVPMDGTLFQKSRAHYNSNRRYTMTTRDIKNINLITNTYRDTSRKIVLVVSDDTTAEKTLRRDLRYWAETTAIDFDNAILLEEEPDSLWVTKNELFVVATLDEIVAEAKKIRKEERAQRGPGTGEFTYTVLTLKKNSDGKLSVEKSEVGYKSLPSSGYYFQRKGNIYFEDRIERFHYEASKDRIVEIMSLLDIKEGVPVVLLTQAQTEAALDRRVKGSYTSAIDALRSIYSTIIADASDAEYAYSDLSINSYFSRRVLDNLAVLVNVKDKFNDDSPLIEALSFYTAGLTFSEKTDILKNLFGVIYREEKATDSRAAHLMLLTNLCEMYPLLSLDSSDATRFDSAKNLQHVIDYVNMTDSKGSK